MIREPNPEHDSIQEDIDAALQRYEWGDATPADMQLLNFFGIQPESANENQRQH